MEPTNLLNEHGTFKCKVCDFKSQNKNAVKNHLLDHINDSLPDDADYSDDDEIENSEQGKTKTKADNIMDLIRMVNNYFQIQTQNLKQNSNTHNKVNKNEP